MILKKNLKVLLYGVGVLAATLMLRSLMLRLKPSQLYIHPPVDAWSKVTIDSTNISGPISFFPKDVPIRISPIEHGVYRMHIEFNDGLMAWAKFLHHDTGKRRRIDVKIERDADQKIHFIQLANESEVLFKGSVKAQDTSAQMPFMLDWI